MSIPKSKVRVQLQKSESNLMWYYYVNLPEEIASLYISGKDRRVICTMSDGSKVHRAILSTKEAGPTIFINQELRKKLGLRRGEVFEFEIEKDDSAFGTNVSEEFEAVMDQDQEANHWFQKLTPGKQRSLIYFSDNVKSSDIRIRRALVVANHLKINAGVLDFRALNQEIKEANQAAKLR